MLSLAGNYRYFLFRGAADMRKSFDGLSGLVRSVLLCDPLSGDIFIFLNARRNQIKLLAWEQDGFAVYHKRLERGTFELPDASCQGTSIHLSKEKISLILGGVHLSSVRYRTRFSLEKKG
ncbi:MAG: IS66 family insertion sequence element accessory protein TnpB [Bacteroidales bacterium]